MYYIVLETEVSHSNENPKDSCTISSLSFQIIKATSLENFVCDGAVKTIGLDDNGEQMSLANIVKKFESEVLVIVNDEEFVLCSMNSTWDIRVTIQRQAHDEAVKLPKFLKFPKIFDLWKEFDRWCVNHSNVVNKNNIKKIRDLEELVTIFELPNTSHEKIIDIEMTSNVLKKLYEKCDTEQDTINVLTKPYDLKLDYETFINEESKVFYMNNLPPDTTQSELESWFAQFGLRNVTFWAVKSILDENSNTGTRAKMCHSPYVEEQNSVFGFAVFQSHQEAVEATSLNGRSILSNIANSKQSRIVEHVVELQPSSNKVLEKVQDILSPFSQSKNKPRPGDWTCFSCGFSNFQRRTACFRCSFPAVPNTTGGYNIGNTYNAGRKFYSSNTQNNDNRQNNNKVASVSSQFSYNSGQNFTSYNSTSYADYMTANSSAYRYSPNKSGSNSNHFNANFDNLRVNGQYDNTNGVSGSNVPFRAGDWKCFNCTYHNFAKNVVCLRCGGPKTTSTEQENVYHDSNHYSQHKSSNQNNVSNGNDINGNNLSLMDIANIKNGNTWDNKVLGEEVVRNVQ